MKHRIVIVLEFDKMPKFPYEDILLQTLDPQETGKLSFGGVPVENYEIVSGEETIKTYNGKPSSMEKVLDAVLDCAGSDAGVLLDAPYVYSTNSSWRSQEDEKHNRLRAFAKKLAAWISLAPRRET